MALHFTHYANVLNRFIRLSLSSHFELEFIFCRFLVELLRELSVVCGAHAFASIDTDKKVGKLKVNTSVEYYHNNRHLNRFWHFICDFFFFVVLFVFYGVSADCFMLHEHSQACFSRASVQTSSVKRQIGHNRQRARRRSWNCRYWSVFSLCRTAKEELSSCFSHVASSVVGQKIPKKNLRGMSVTRFLFLMGNSPCRMVFGRTNRTTDTKRTTQMNT